MPDTRYAKSGGVHVAYQVVGQGPPDIVFVPGLLSHLDLTWADPLLNRFFTRMASFGRVILFDKRGTGLSDRDVGIPTLEERMDDVRAVMDAAGSERAALFGYSDGGAMSMLFAATYPYRTSALVLCTTSPRAAADADFPWGAELEAMADGLLRIADDAWGSGETLRYFGASLMPIAVARENMGHYERLSVSPSGARALVEMDMLIDVRPVLPAIAVPTLVISRTDDHAIPPACGRYLAEHIAGARYWEQPGEHLLGLGDTEALLDEVQEFLVGIRPPPEVDRVLATVAFTDIVGSTERAAALGDRRWRELLAAHHMVVRRELDRFRGQEVDTAGDGFFATFDGPGRAIRCACAIRDAVTALGLEVRVGLHTGEVELGGEKVGGIAVHIGARVAAIAGAGEVWVSRTVVDLVAGSGIAFSPRGVHEFKGVPGMWEVFAAAA